MKLIVMVAVVAAGLAVSGVANASEALAKSSGCLTCHDMAAKKMGPSFKDIAAKFKGKSDADVLAAVKASKPHASSKASDADLKALGKWILAM